MCRHALVSYLVLVIVFMLIYVYLSWLLAKEFFVRWPDRAFLSSP